MIYKKHQLYLLIICLSLTSCFEKNSTDANETFEYWSGYKAPDELQLLEGKYWESPHLFKEYIMYLKFKPSDKWWNQFIELNYLSEDTDSIKSFTKTNETPDWFNPSENSTIHIGDQGSRYFRDTITGISYIYEIQL